MNQQERSQQQIAATKQRITDALLVCLSAVPFEHITVTGICKRAHASRITFYTYYTDKYELLDNFFQKMIDDATKDFRMLQKTKNQSEDPVQSWCNLLDSILDLYSTYGAFLSHAESDKDPYLYFCYHQHVLHTIEQFTKKYCIIMKPKYSVEQTSSLLCNGLWGFIKEGHIHHIPEEKIRVSAEDSLRIMIRSGLFSRAS